MSRLSSHILDTSIGKPAAGITAVLYLGSNDQWEELNRDETNADGRIQQLSGENELQQGMYKIRFETKDYFDKAAIPTFYPYVEIIFEIGNDAHYHIPLLLNPFGYSTYRGS